MKPVDRSISNTASDSDTLLGTLPADPQSVYASQSEESTVSKPNSRATHDEVRQTDSSLAPDTVPKGKADLGRHRPSSVSVKDLAALYGLNIGAIYALIKTEPDFPYVNAGIKKKFLVDVAQFETWLAERTKKQKHERFAVPSYFDLETVFKNKPPGGIK